VRTENRSRSAALPTASELHSCAVSHLAPAACGAATGARVTQGAIHSLRLRASFYFREPSSLIIEPSGYIALKMHSVAQIS